MKKSLALLAVFGVFIVAGGHDFLLFCGNGEKTSGNIGFGHDFPKSEPIDAERVNNFEAPLILGKDGKVTLKQSGENYHYEGAKLKDGTYAITGEYKPTFWTEDADGKWHMGGTKKTIKNAKFCRRATMSAKSVINVGAGDDFITKSTGQRLEIVPLENPAKFKVGEPFKVKVLFEGKPLKVATIDGTFDGFLKDKSAFHATTDLKGETEVLALRPGKWVLKVVHKFPYADAKKCDEETAIASFTFEIK
ncbi:DUF4198 domain-containing protein [Campylobacter sp. Marseille-Q3452]|uniref:DUF4198 domain-containing protein n=1 Tax=Campylobacter massiliensis TaxID=2762557 RepID=A0A842J909_9BACT|nr:DUF4198 domain-containing protein [Campylobacter massiliensis]MBC2882499.1 DUF4198 domain-containing protein [Campylobacter massiliensis]